ncbi:MAG TPA: SIS domain-containing protein [Candidatus Scybalocola faecipullorum]|nr:SIS domain-containing protein [Candidatus Scybalocola faecipullorum]
MKIDYKKVVGEILASRKEQGGIDKIYFAACGGSKAGLTPADFFISCESKKLHSWVYTAKEFVLCTPKALDENSVVVTLSFSGSTPEAVEAAALAQKAGAVSVTLTGKEDSPLGACGDYVFYYGDEPKYQYSTGSMAIALRFAIELVHQIEGYDHYDQIQNGFDILDDVIRKARDYAVPGALAFAQAHKNEPVIHVMASGANYNVAYTTTTCILMECQWIHSNPIHCGEFFHGPFEVVDKEVPFLVLVGTGRERAMDERAVAFLNKYGKKVTVLDAKEFGIDILGDGVCEYLSPLVFTGVLSIYSHKLADARCHSVDVRRYMWHVAY